MVSGVPARPSGIPPPPPPPSAALRTSEVDSLPPPPKPGSSACEPPPPFVDARGASFPSIAFADNDDAGSAGCLRSAWRLSCYARWTLLVGGRERYERNRTSVLEPPRNNPAARLRLCFPDAASGLGPQAVGSEAGAFVHAVFHYDCYSAHARRAASVGLLPRPPCSLPPTSLAPLPGFVELSDRIAAHAGHLLAWEPAEERLVPGLAAPAWGLDESNDWRLVAPPVDNACQ